MTQSKRYLSTKKKREIETGKQELQGLAVVNQIVKNIGREEARVRGGKLGKDPRGNGRRRVKGSGKEKSSGSCYERNS